MFGILNDAALSAIDEAPSVPCAGMVWIRTC